MCTIAKNPAVIKGDLLYCFLTPAVVPPVVTLDSTTPTTIPLTWTSPGPVVDSYVVTWTSRECPDVDEGSTSTITDGSTSYTISGLQEGSSYTVNVTATNTAGSAVSDPVSGRTQDTSECSLQTLLTEVRNFMYCSLQLHLPLPLLSVHLT